MADLLGPEAGITRDALDGWQPRAKEMVARFKRARERGGAAFADLAYKREELSRINELAGRVRSEYKNFVHLGIGGSSLGPKALHLALNSPCHNLLSPESRAGAPRIFFAENVDPDTLTALVDVLEPAETFINVVSKSGGTVETVSQFLYFRHWLKKHLPGEDVSRHLAIITDAQKGELRRFADQEGITSFAVPPGVEGRYSVLSPVGLFPAAVMGIDIDQLLQGAASVDPVVCCEQLWENMALMAAVLFYLYRQERGKSQLVIMPYSDRLYAFGQWFRQLWAESLGKNGRGTTPVLALGTVDQHSQFQLYLEGPRDKLILFIKVGSFPARPRVPSGQGVEGFDYLKGRGFDELLDQEQKATELALAQGQCGSCSLTVPELNAHGMGQLIFVLEMVAVYAGMLYQVNPFDQPGVEKLKRILYGLMGRPGYRAEGEEVSPRDKKPGRYVI